MQEITMRYPYIFYSGKVEHCPVFRGLEGDPLIVDLSSESSFLAGILPIDQKILQNRIEEAMGYLYSWGIAS
ncbi:MAG: hypothetical protein PF495_03775 [Spirochaetales bacterium]|jgi:hypothetical protein|nr:hypothetical protein [Spirochaetales bacterium]